MKCFILVTDRETRKKRKCKCKPLFNIDGHRYCNIHARIIYNHSVIIIQKIWRSYRTNLKLKNLYFNLPTELQQKVLYYLTVNTIFSHNYDKNFVPLINTIILNKHRFNISNNNSNFNISRQNILKLVDKYKDILYDFNYHNIKKSLSFGVYRSGMPLYITP